MDRPRVFADFQNSDTSGRVRLNTVGAMEDLSRSGIVLSNGTPLLLYCDELEVEGVAVYSQEEGIWTAKINWDEVRRTD